MAAKVRMSNKLQVEVKVIYGVEKIYPLCHSSRLFSELLGQQTLTRENCNKIKELGYEFEVITPVRSL